MKEKAEEPPAAAKTISTRAEKTQVEERAAIGANVVYEVIRREGDDERVMDRLPAIDQRVVPIEQQRARRHQLSRPPAAA